MPRLRSAVTGAVVSCSGETAARLGGEWRPVSDGAASQAPAPAKRGRKPKPVDK